MTPPRRRGPAWEHLGYGVQAPAGLAGPLRLHAVLAAWAEVLPAEHAFTGLTAAQAHGLWLPPVPDDLPVFVDLLETSARRRRRGLRTIRRSDPPTALDWRGVRVAPVPETLLACAAELALLDLVVLVDSALHLRRCSRADLEAVAAAPRRGAPRLRAVLSHADRAESAWEVLLRMLHRSCGVPVEPQVDLVDDHGLFLARADLLVVGTRTLQEYDGAGHLARRQYRDDRRRDAALARAGYVRHGWVAEQVMRQAPLVLAEAQRARGLSPVVDPTPWFDLLGRSLFSRSGSERLRRRWT